ncbi:MAG TPA: hypothetical protein PLW73_11265, partial [Methanoregulaceae archaeon]|nr:hypothetical protein [Methanoregulaceae archaeon]
KASGDVLTTIGVYQYTISRVDMSTLASYVKEWFQSDYFREPGGLSEVCVSDTDREGLCTCERCGLDPRSENFPSFGR